MQALVIGVKNEYTIDKLQTLRLPPIASTNLTPDELSEFHIAKKFPIEADAPHRYMFFRPNCDGLLLWLDFGSKLKVNLPIPYEARVWTNQVHVCILRGKK